MKKIEIKWDTWVSMSLIGGRELTRSGSNAGLYNCAPKDGKYPVNEEAAADFHTSRDWWVESDSLTKGGN